MLSNSQTMVQWVASTQMSERADQRPALPNAGRVTHPVVELDDIHEDPAAPEARSLGETWIRVRVKTQVAESSRPAVTEEREGRKKETEKKKEMP